MARKWNFQSLIFHTVPLQVTYRDQLIHNLCQNIVFGYLDTYVEVVFLIELKDHKKPKGNLDTFVYN